MRLRCLLCPGVSALMSSLAWGQSGGAAELVKRLATRSDVTPEVLRADPPVRRLVVLDLAAVPSLRAALTSGKATTRASAAFVLGQIGAVDALAPLYRSETDPMARFVIVTACHRFGVASGMRTASQQEALEAELRGAL